MITPPTLKNNPIALALLGVLTVVSSYIMLSYSVGSYTIKFSGINIVLPLIGSFLSPTLTVLIVAAFFIFRSLLSITPFTFGIPTILAALNWNMYSAEPSRAKRAALFLLNILLPLTCMILFCIHPIGKQAYAYSFYWLIPVILFMIQLTKGQSWFFTALSSTFIAHAVGSVIWLYWSPFTASYWLSLIPLVAVERLTFAIGSTLVYQGVVVASKTLGSLSRSNAKYPQ